MDDLLEQSIAARRLAMYVTIGIGVALLMLLAPDVIGNVHLDSAVENALGAFAYVIMVVGVVVGAQAWDAGSRLLDAARRFIREALASDGVRFERWMRCTLVVQNSSAMLGVILIVARYFVHTLTLGLTPIFLAIACCGMCTRLWIAARVVRQAAIIYQQSPA